jgi:glycosyltransferase involved in cell wall biosynthesis
LQSRGHEVEVLTGKPNYPGGQFFPGYGMWRRALDEFCGIRIMRVPLLARGRAGGVRLALNYLSFALAASIAAPFRCRGKYDIILVYEPSPVTVGLPALALKVLKQTPIMFWVQDLWPESLSATGAVTAPWLLKPVEWLVRMIYRGCDRILVQSHAFIEPIVRLGAERSRLEYFPNSAEALYRPVELAADAPERAGLPEGFRVMFAGNIGAAQDFATIIEAAALLKQHPDIHWLVLGDGRMLDWVKQQVAACGLEHSVHLLGRRPVDTMPRYFALADAMLVTLKRAPIFALTIPTKLQSYLACAKPVIGALDGEGARVIREADAGVAVPAQDPQALAQAVLALYRMNEVERRTLGTNGRRYFEQHFEREALLDRLEAWMRELRRNNAACAS